MITKWEQGGGHESWPSKLSSKGKVKSLKLKIIWKKNVQWMRNEVLKQTRQQIVSKLMDEIIWILQQTKMSAVVVQINSWGHNLSCHILGLIPRMGSLLSTK